MNLILYPLLSTRSKRAILRVRRRWGHPYIYTPKYELLSRLSQETGMSPDIVEQRLSEEREWLLRHRRYFI